MQFKRLLSGVGISSAVLACSLLLTACPSKITQEQLAKLQELRREEKSLRQQISSTQDKKSSLERELQSRQSEVNNCNKDMEFVKQKLAQWPDVWPDWKPEPPQKEAQEEK